MIDLLGSHSNLVELPESVHLVKADVGGQDLKGYRKIRLLHQFVKRLLQGALTNAGKMDIEPQTGIMGRGKERESLNMIHVEVADQQIHLGHFFPRQRQSQFTDSG